MSKILAKVIRGETVESIHRGHFIVIEGTGDTVCQLGDPETVTFWRSAAKPFQAMPFIVSGAADAFGITEQEIALACASHSGQKFHTELAEKMLAKCSFNESDLRCGVHPPIHNETAEEMVRSGETPTQLHNNCSGKHSAMIAFAKHICADTETYLSTDNPAQKAVFETISRFTGIALNEIGVGIDGCSAPCFAVPISVMALAFAKLISPPDDFDSNLKNSCRRIVDAMTHYPEIVGGKARFDTKIMQVLKGKIVSKIGAEGVWCAGVLPCEKWKNGLAIALKIEDGNGDRARPVVVIELLRQLGILDESGAKNLSDLSPIIMQNRKDRAVGKVVAEFEI